MNNNNLKDRPFINFSNHPADKWDPEQVKAALHLGAGIIDLPFPSVDPNADTASLALLAEKMTETILRYQPSAVMCQGEFGLCYSVIKRLQAEGVIVLHACSVRNVQVEGNTKTVRFDFVQFRRYE